jgi:pyruvate carboxylase
MVIEDMDLGQERYELAEKIGKEPTDQQLVLYLQHPNDAVDFFSFEEEFGHVYVLPPSIFFHRGGFDIGQTLTFRDHFGKEHIIEVGPSPVSDSKETNVYFSVDHHQSVFTFPPDADEAGTGLAPKLTKEEIMDLAQAGDIRSPFSGNVYEISVKEGQEVLVGDRVAIMEAMKMQTPVLSTIGGIVTAVSAKQGDSLETGDKILQISKEE